MLIRVMEGSYDPSAGATSLEALEPRGRVIWSGDVQDLTAAALPAADIKIDPGTWYSFEDFKSLVRSDASVDEWAVVSSVTAIQSGVVAPWPCTIEVAERRATLMVCLSVLNHIEQIQTFNNVWVRVE